MAKLPLDSAAQAQPLTEIVTGRVLGPDGLVGIFEMKAGNL